jgi:hypothetical protein
MPIKESGQRPHTAASLREQACVLHLKAIESLKHGNVHLSNMLLNAALRDLEGALSLEAAEAIRPKMTGGANFAVDL